MPFGFHNKILRVDLTEGKTWVEEPGELVYRKYLGGSSLSLYYLLRELPKGIDPLGPENILIFAASVITGTQIAGGSRYTVAARSPAMMLPLPTTCCETLGAPGNLMIRAVVFAA